MPLLCLLLLPTISRGQIEITLKNSFIERYRNRATIDSSYTVDKAHAQPNPPKKDGDLHVAGRDDDIGLPIVAEIMNARLFRGAVDLIHEVEGTDEPVAISGVWRIWCEHGGTEPQVQGAKLKAFKTTNPHHVFEIHPITRIKDISLLKSLQPIKGFQTKDAARAFTAYENLRCELIPNGGTTKIVTDMGGFNYVEFMLELNGEPQPLEDGSTAVMCKVRDLEGELLVRNRRMIFAKDTEPEKKVKALSPGKRLHVLGLPRISLELVHWRVEHAKERPEVLKWRLPYEIIVAAVYPDEAEDSDTGADDRDR
jgi:hypothetical protein